MAHADLISVQTPFFKTPFFFTFNYGSDSCGVHFSGGNPCAENEYINMKIEYAKAGTRRAHCATLNLIARYYVKNHLVNLESHTRG